MSKPKALLKQSKLKKKAEPTLDTADDFQAAGVDYEEAAGKWRAGDAAKALRFFSRAIDVYDQGLQKFPGSLDLAYNKARVLLELATHPRLVPELQSPVLPVLHQALDAHRYTLTLDRDNPDTLFNAAQVLTAIAEIVARQPDHAEQEALQILKEAVDLQARCLAIQEVRWDESKRLQDEAIAALSAEDRTFQAAGADDPPMSDALDDKGSGTAEERQWFSIQEPVTADTLIDTVIAELGTLTTLCSVINSSDETNTPSSLAWIEERSTELIKAKLPILLHAADTDQIHEVALTTANFISALLESGYRSGSIDAQTYKRERDTAFQDSRLDLETNFAALLANAASLVAFSCALGESEDAAHPSQSAPRWNALNAAITNMATASKVGGPVPDDLAETHFVRGNCSLLQYQLARPPFSYPPAVQNAPQLLTNADVLFRNAGKLFQDSQQKRVAQFRAGVTRALQAGNDVVATAMAQDPAMDGDWVFAQLEEMADDGLIRPVSGPS